MDALGGLPVPGLALVAFGGWSLLIGAVWLYFRGKLVSEAEHVRAIAYRDSVVEVERAEKVMWRDAALAAQESARVSNAQSSQMLEGLGTVEQLLRGLMAERDRT
ncbi:MAG TPA: hypothetical protein VFX61_13240 [Micromonosporaceae bacterium]|nr:hypothetical protein [Micromonosporaceae bacterium]